MRAAPSDAEFRWYHGQLFALSLLARGVFVLQKRLANCGHCAGCISGIAAAGPVEWLVGGTKETPRHETVKTVFTEEEYVNYDATVETHWHHEQIKAAFETKDYFVFFLSDRHGQIYDKHGFLEGTPEEFSKFISEQTGKPVEYIK